VRILRYFIVGGMAATVDIGFFLLFAKLAGFNYLVVAPLGFVLATWVNYQLSIRHVFRSGVRFTRGREIFLVYAVSAVGLASSIKLCSTFWWTASKPS
jgi:putative flippase GtrA